MRQGHSDFSTDGNTVRLPPALIQPWRRKMSRVRWESSGWCACERTVEIAGPEKFRLNELIRQGLSAWNDPREVVADPHARYYGVAVSESTLVPGDDARLSQTLFADWLRHSAFGLMPD